MCYVLNVIVDSSGGNMKIYYTLSNFWYNFKWFFVNIYKLRYSLSNTRPWDYSGLYLLLRDQIREMEACQTKYSYHTCKDRNTKKMKVCLGLLDRLITDDYTIDKQNFHCEGKDFLEWHFTPKHFLPRSSKFIHKLSDTRQKQDRELLFKYLNKYSNHWWS